MSDNTNNKKPSLPYGEVQGYADGVPAYSNGHDMHFSGVRNFDDKIFTGFRWQCVEFSRRWLLERKGLLLPDINWAANIFENISEVEDVRTGDKVRTVPVRNGGSEKPEKDTLLIYPSVPRLAPFGHVAVITEVGKDYVRIADQNQHYHKWEGNYSAELPLKYDEEKKTYMLQDKIEGELFTPMGWMTFPDTPNRDPNVPLQWHPKYKLPTYPPIRLRRRTITPKETKSNWLDVTNPAEKKFVETFGMDVSRTRLNEAVANYYEGNWELMLACVRYSQECHEMFLEATQQVLASDELMTKFGIPSVFWEKIRNSWKNQRRCLTGRFDFAVNNEQGTIKVFEYNADSAATLLECGRIQQKYAEAIGIDEDSRGSGWRIEDQLQNAWERSGVKGLVHFCVDNDDEEQYTALYVMENAMKVGLQTKLCVMFDEFSFNDEGKIVDSEGNLVKTVWKTWMWETGFKDYELAKKERGADYKPKKGDKVRLCDIILSDDDSIRVFEPLWKVIPSNKAILPLVYKNHPDHPMLLRAEYELTDELRKAGYAKKPIVGRTGQNITIVDESGSTMKESSGSFSDRNWVYQEKFNLTEQDEYYAILGAWVIGEEAGGVGIREDKTVITGSESPFSALRWRDNFAPNTHVVLNEHETDHDADEYDKKHPAKK